MIVDWRWCYENPMAAAAEMKRLQAALRQAHRVLLWNTFAFAVCAILFAFLLAIEVMR